ncbi:MAG: tRNA (cytidine(56)-2'-O)-methyltransferase [Thermoprotei archaeon]|nr:MAG: tRNA (cytidine(56)-2'-O)-methyltransferase [Thermoprotei archaeon]
MENSGLEKYKVYVLRIGHRPSRDKRVTTHVALVARAFGAKGFILGDVVDKSVEESIRKVIDNWGGKDFEIIMGINSVKYVKEWRNHGCVVHLTMYGINIPNIVNEIKEKCQNILVIVGAEKVPRIFYEISHYNVAVGHQPHSEVAALAIFLDRLWEGKEINITFPDAKLVIVPQFRGKKVVKRS